MNSKKWAVSLVSITLLLVIAFGGMTYYLDPLLQFDNERGPLTYRQYTEMYSNPGIAKNYEYTAVLLGSSMVENTDVSELDKLFDCKTIKVPYSGASSYNHKTILDVCYNSGHKIEKVFWSLDEYALTTDKNTPRYPLPDYLYDDNIFNDLSYLLNLDIFYFYTSKDIAGTLKHQNQIMMRDGSWIEDESIYCKENALATVSYPLEQLENKGEKYYQKNLTENLQQNIIPFLRAHPETEFHYYMVPYSILYWYQIKQNGTLEAEIYNAKSAVGEILKYSNAKVHFFQNEEDIITNLDNYKDYTHFKPEINSWMSKEMQKGSHILTQNNYIKTIDAFYRYLDDFEFNGLFKNEI